MKMVLDQEEKPNKECRLGAIKWKATEMPSFENAPAPRITKNSKIIIVEDDVDAVFPINKVLKKINKNISYCMTGKEALEVIPILMPDLIILDWNLGDMNAVSILYKLNRLLGHCGDKTINLITYSSLEKDEVSVDSYSNFNHLAHWQKPLTINQVKHRVRQLELS